MKLDKRVAHLFAAATLACLTGRAQAQTYDMKDYMFHDNQNKANVIAINGSTSNIQVFRAYDVTSDRFYITKNWTGTGATDWEEFTWDGSWIYLVRDTSWQSNNWCPGLGETSFELWSGGRNRGAWIPRYVQSGISYPTPAFEIRARREGNGCTICDSPSDTNGGTTSRTVKADRFASYYFSTTGKTLADVIRLTVTSGPGTGEKYYFSKTLGWVGYEDPTTTNHYLGPANNGNDFAVAVINSCPGATGCRWIAAQGGLYHQIGRADGYDWSAQTNLHSSGYLSYGPYDPQWGAGSHYAQYLLWIDNNSASNDIVATLDVVTAGGGRVLARRDLRRTEFSAAQQWQWFTVWFSYPSFEQLETRVYWHDTSYLKHGQQYICKQ